MDRLAAGSGIHRQALYPLWGEASWNAYGVFYYFSGFIFYLLLGLYLRRFSGNLSWTHLCFDTKNSKDRSLDNGLRV